MVLVDAFLIINELKDEFDINEKYTKKKLMDLIIEKCNKYTKTKKITNDKDKKITVYNEFVKTQMPIIRAEFPNMIPKEHMTLIGKKWRENKKKIETDDDTIKKNNIKKDDDTIKKDNIKKDDDTIKKDNIKVDDDTITQIDDNINKKDSTKKKANIKK